MRDLVKDAIEIREDIDLARLAETREKSVRRPRALTHKDVWGQFTFTVKYHPDVKYVDLPMINVKMRERIRRAIESRLMTAPLEYGLPLRKNLGGYWKLRVGDYRVVFKVEGEVIYISFARPSSGKP